MLNQQMEVDGWYAQWLDRELPGFEYYVMGVVYTISLFCIASGIITGLRLRRSQKALKDATSTERGAIIKKQEQIQQSQMRRLFFVALGYLLNTFVIAMIDAYIGTMVIRDAVAEDPQAWTSAVILEAVVYCLYLFIIFTTTFIFVPLLQMVFVTWLLTRFARKKGISSLSEYVPQARAHSTSMASTWAVLGFVVMAFWPPTDNGLYRYLIIQAAIGSTVTWLDASFAFNFCADKLGDEELPIRGGMKDIVRMFGKTVSVVHWSEKKGEMLPQYVEDVASEQSSLLSEEKA